MDQLQWRPAQTANTIGFILWHILRTWDGYLALILEKGEIYEEGEWQERFGFDTRGRGVEGSGMGTGFKPEDVAVVTPEVEVLNEYLKVLLKETISYLKNNDEASLGREMTVPWWGFPTPVARVFSHIIGHSYFHLGEAQYIRGLMGE
jgi:uncharacterized damage-inducible protein DinB